MTQASPQFGRDSQGGLRPGSVHGPAAGRAALWLLLGFLAVAGLGFWFAGGLPGTKAAGEKAALEPDRITTARPELEPTPNVARMRDLGDPTVREAVASEAEGEAPGPAALVRNFNGKGSLAGRATVLAGQDFPKTWTLHLEPSGSLSLEGRERAITKDVVFEDGREEFRVDDLPFGGYSVRATAPGMNGVPVDVALFKRQEYAYIVLRMTPAGFLDGGVVDAQGTPVDDLAVILERTEDRTRTEVKTDTAGNYIFHDVLDGEYQLFLGSTETPLLPPRSLRFQAPSLRFPTSTLPPTASVILKAVDRDGRPVPEVLFRGYGTKSGTIDGTADDVGEYRARFLPSGRFRVTAYVDKAPRGKVNFDLEIDASSEPRVIEVPIE